MPVSFPPTTRRREAAADRRPAGLLQISVAGLLWGTVGLAVRRLHEAASLEPASIAFYRLAIAGALLLVLAATRRRLGRVIAVLRGAPVVVVLSGAVMAAYQALYYVAVIEGGVGIATVVSLGLAPLVAAGWESFRGRTAPSARTSASLIAGVTGLVLVTASTADGGGGPRPMLGLLTAIASGVGYAVGAILGRHATRLAAPLDFTVVTSLVGAVCLAPLAASGGLRVPVDGPTIGVLLYLGAVATAVASALFYAGLRTTAGSTAVLLTLLEPLTAAVLAAAFLDERLAQPAILGGLLMLGSVALIYVGPGRRPTSPEYG